MNLTWALSYSLVSLVTGAIILLIYIHVNYDMGGKEDIGAFRDFLRSFFGFVIFNGACIWANYINLRIIGTVFTTLSLIGLCATAYYWFYYIEVRLRSPKIEKRTNRLIMMAPMLIVVIVIVTSPITHLIFHYDREGVFQRGVLYPIILTAAALYLVTATLQTSKKLSSARTRAQKKQYRYLMIFIVFPFVAGIIDFAYAHLPSMELVVTFGIVLIYLNLQHAQIYRDGLTGLNNRRHTDEYIQENIGFASPEKPIYFFLVDIDHFKSINDRFGHVEGDRALKLVSDVLKKYEDSGRCYASRWGGDEMVIIVDTEDEFDPESFKNTLFEEVREEVKLRGLQYDIMISTGYVKCTDPDMEVDRIIRLADQRMYADKMRKEQ